MALHACLDSLTEEAIEEYLAAAGLCTRIVKPRGGCLGFAAALLLLATVEAMGHFLEGESVRVCDSQRGKERSRKITKGEPFLVLNHACFGQDLTAEQIKHVESAYRHPLAHNGRIGDGALLYLGVLNGAGPAFFIEEDQVKIDVKALHALVAAAWGRLDKTTIQSSIERQLGRHAPKRRHP